MKQYNELLGKVLVQGNHRMDRTGVGTTALFCAPIKAEMAV